MVLNGQLRIIHFAKDLILVEMKTARSSLLKYISTAACIFSLSFGGMAMRTVLMDAYTSKLTTTH